MSKLTAHIMSHHGDDRLAQEVMEIEKENKILRSALSAMLTEMGLDENEYNKPTFDQARKALTPNVCGKGDALLRLPLHRRVGQRKDKDENKFK
jgi:hypothetical protein